MLLTCLSIPAQKKGIDEKILVVYFSHSGNTRTVAEQITRSTGADLFEIQPQEAYPTDYHSVVDQAKKGDKHQSSPCAEKRCTRFR